MYKASFPNSVCSAICNTKTSPNDYQYSNITLCWTNLTQLQNDKISGLFRRTAFRRKFCSMQSWVAVGAEQMLSWLFIHFFPICLSNKPKKNWVLVLLSIWKLTMLVLYTNSTPILESKLDHTSEDLMLFSCWSALKAIDWEHHHLKTIPTPPNSLPFHLYFTVHWIHLNNVL